MNRKVRVLSFFTMAAVALSVFAQTEIAPGVIKLQKGEVDKYTPYEIFGGNPKVEAMAQLPEGKLPFDINDLKIFITDRGCKVEIPLTDGEELYGFGLQIETFKQRGLRKTPKVNDNPLNGLGYTHAPQPFYVSTKGYGVLVNTARYTTFLCGSNWKNDAFVGMLSDKDKKIATTTDDLYRNQGGGGGRVYVDIPGANGIEVFVITGPELIDVVKRYNLLSGGGCVPPMWGLGFKYRVKGDAVQDSVMRFADYFREKSIPCDVLGLEPGWQTAAYSCSYKWSDERFPTHADMLADLNEMGYKVNLWEHAYVHPSSPIRKDIGPYSGDFVVWGGVVPDFLTAQARDIFAEYHSGLVAEGVSGFKLDECDNSNISYASATWCFPDVTQFPSGLDGERMHQLFGALYLDVVDGIYRKQNRRTYHYYRASGLFMSSRSAVLYSDTYNHREYIQALCNSAFGGLLWCPEVREAGSADDFFHRLQTAILSPQAMVNAWYLQYAPWLQFDRGKNERGEFLPEAAEYENYARTLIEMRMQLLPYIYSAFYKYHIDGTPPFRPLLMDYPTDKKTLEISDQYMIGDVLMAAPIHAAGKSRKVYFPEGTWYDFNNNVVYEGGREYEVTTEYDQLPLYVKKGAVLPLAAPVQCVTPETVFDITCKVYGADSGNCKLYEDDGISLDYLSGKYNVVNFSTTKGKAKMQRQGKNGIKRYRLAGCELVK